ncbi:MAG: hypothetical protein A2293_15475 [Elusimicrobia bacterium RIFOXYB2_FULL_49_7]|nr:MAG: hypothetical protein A2293_15475 [Elusimicrobia bacterium RIFOXYB2_FULL_49_7]
MKKIKIIADISSNHRGDIRIAKKMIAKAASLGIDCVKFQSWQAKNLNKSGKFDYPSTYERHKKTELSDENHFELISCCKKYNVEFLTTCFDPGRIDFLASLGLKSIKVASPDCGSTTLIKKLMSRFETLIISTGMSTEDEIASTIRLLGSHDYVLLHCVSLYPTPLDKCNISRIGWLRKMGAKRVGFSDHSHGSEAAMAAMSMDIELLEKHFTLDRRWPGKDQKMSSTPSTFSKIIAWRSVCEKVYGTENPALSAEEARLKSIYTGKWGNNK